MTVFPMFDEAHLRRVAGETIFSRGKAYWREGRVRFSSTAETDIRATVAGTEKYKVRLKKTRSGLTGSCSCPAFEDMPVCKHMVAVALAANDLPKESGGQGRANDGDPIAAYLQSLSREKLVDMVRGLADQFPDIERSLGLAANILVKDDKTILARYRGALDEAITIENYIEYSEAGGWAAAIDEVLNAIALLVDDGRPAIAMQLVEEAIADLGECIGMIDDSNGEIGTLVYHCREIHGLAAAKVKPDPIEFAAKLVEMVLENEVFEASEIVSFYGDILGVVGLAEVERFSLEFLDRFTPLKRGAQYWDDPHFLNRSSLIRLADDCARQRGDVDARVALKKRDLGHAYDYVNLVEMLFAEGRDADALNWAREGLFLFEDNQDERLVAAALPLLDRAGQQKEADELVWTSFAAKPSKALFNTMIVRANETSRHELTEKVIAHLQARLARADADKVQHWHDVELLIEVLTNQGHYAQAWQTVDSFKLPMRTIAQENLIEASLETHPERATGLWRQQLEHLVQLGGSPNYESAHKLLTRLADVAAKAGTLADHSAYVDELRVVHKAKRNFMKLFDR